MTGVRFLLLILSTFMVGCSPAEKPAEHGRFVTTGWLQDHLYDTSLVIIYIGSEQTYDSIHIPGSRIISLRGLLIDTDSLRHEFPDIRVIDSILENAGINDHSLIVTYYENEMMIPAAARFFVTLEYAGFVDRSYVLNGGMVKWQNEGRTLTDSIYTMLTGKINRNENNSFLINAGDVNKYRLDTGFVLIDARPANYFTGYFDSTGQQFTGGHIEGAVNLSFNNLLSETDPFLFRDDAELMEEFEKIGMNRNKTAIHYCGSGIWASANYLVSSHLGYRSVFYDGSFDEWEKLGLPLIKPVLPDTAEP